MEDLIQNVYDFLLKSEHDVEKYFLVEKKKIDMIDALPFVFCSAIIWTIISSLFDHDPYAASSLHALILGTCGSINLFLGHNELEPYGFYILSGYFLSDFFIRTSFNLRNSLPNQNDIDCLKPEYHIYVVHHVLTVAASYLMINGRHWNEALFASSCWLIEFSTPLLNLYQVHKTQILALLFSVSFFLLRIVWLGYLSFVGWGTAINNLESAMIFGFTGLNFYWFYVMIMTGYRSGKEKQSLNEPEQR